MLRYSILIPALMGMTAFFFVRFFPLVRFVPSKEWIELTKFFTGPILLALGVVQIWVLIWDPQKYDAYVNQRWENRSRWTRPAPISDKASDQLWLAFGVPFFLWAMYFFVIVIWVPIATIAVSHKQASHEFIVTGFEDGLKGPDFIEFDGFNVMLGGLLGPPSWLWNAAQAGDTIRLSGTGNRWGVFYDEIELIKQE